MARDRLKSACAALAVLAALAAGPVSAQQAPPELRGAPEDELPPLGALQSPQTLPQAIPIAPSAPAAPVAAPRPATAAAAPVPPAIPQAPRFQTARPAERVITPPGPPPSVVAPPVVAAPAASTPGPAVAPPAPRAPIQAGAIPPRPPASQRARPAAAAPVPMLTPPGPVRPTRFASSPAGLTRLGLSVQARGEALCVAPRGGLGPVLEIGGRPAVLAACGPEALPVRLIDGVLYVGEGRSHHLLPMTAPASGCRLADTMSRQRRTLVGVCVSPTAAIGELEEDLRAPGWGRVAAQVRQAGPAYAAGAPVMVVPVAPETPPTPAWAIAGQPAELSTADGELCLTTPGGDQTVGAPVILKPCGTVQARLLLQAR